MCNLCSITTNQAAISALSRIVNLYVSNLSPKPDVLRKSRALIRRASLTGLKDFSPRQIPSVRHPLAVWFHAWTCG
ncbi:hypothetical protein ACVWY3_007635 [Bradyrhizobium sp. USDA 4486]